MSKLFYRSTDDAYDDASQERGIGKENEVNEQHPLPVQLFWRPEGSDEWAPLDLASPLPVSDAVGSPGWHSLIDQMVGLTATTTKRLFPDDSPLAGGSILVQIVGSDTPSWTVDFLGSLNGATYTNWDYQEITEGGQSALSSAQLSFTDTTTRWYVVRHPAPHMEAIATRTTGTLDIRVLWVSESLRQELRTTARGAVIVEGATADGGAVVANPVLVGGQDGTNVQSLLTDTTGRVVVVGAAADGAAVAGNPVRVGGSDGTNTQDLIVESATNPNLRVTLYTAADRVYITALNADGITGASATADKLLGASVLLGLAPDGNLDRIRSIADSGAGLGVLAASPATRGSSDVLATRAVTSGVSTTRLTILTPTTGKKVRVIAFQMVNKSTTLTHTECYFGTGADISTTPANAIWISSMIGTAAAETRVAVDSIVFPDGGGPVGAADAVVSIRTSVDLGGNAEVVLTYREE